MACLLTCSVLLLTVYKAVVGQGPHLSAWNNWKIAAVSVAVDPHVAISLSSTQFTHNGQQVYATVHNVLDPQQDDLLALYTPASVDPRTVIPVQFVNLTAYTKGAYTTRGWAGFK